MRGFGPSRPTHHSTQPQRLPISRVKSNAPKLAPRSSSEVLRAIREIRSYLLFRRSTKMLRTRKTRKRATDFADLAETTREGDSGLEKSTADRYAWVWSVSPYPSFNATTAAADFTGEIQRAEASAAEQFRSSPRNP